MMFTSKLLVENCKDLTWRVTRRTFLSKIFKCGCFDKKKKKEKAVEVPPQQALSMNSIIQAKGMSMPILGLGTWQMGPKEVCSSITAAIENGYRHIDTSYQQGNEKYIGAALANIFAAGMLERKDLFITSKLPNYGMCVEEIENYVNHSLHNLQLNYLDLYLVHFPVGIRDKNPDPHTNHLAIWKELEKIMECGKIRSLGLSNFNCRQMRNIMENGKIPPANLQIELHIYCQQKELREFCKQNCIGVTAYAPLGSPGLCRYLKTHGLKDHRVPQPLENPSIAKIAESQKKCPSHILLRYLLQLGGVAVIPKSSCPDRIIKNTELFDFSLSSCEMQEIGKLDHGEHGRMFFSNVWVRTDEHCEYPFIKPHGTDD